MFVDIPDGARLERIDVTNPDDPKPVFEYLPDSDIGKLKKQMAEIEERVGKVIPPQKEPESLEEWQASKKQEVSAACEAIIYAGVNVTLTDGAVEHFSLTEHDQINLFGKQAQLAAGAEQVEYHADGQPCRYYPAADMRTIIEAAMFHVSYHTTYCNALNVWLAACQTVEEVKEIFYGADVPEEYQSEVLKAYLLQIAQLVEGKENETPVAE